MSTTEDLAALQAKAARAADTAAKAEQAALEAQARAEAERAARLREYDAQVLADYNDGALAAEEKAAYARFRQAVLDDPVFAAWCEVRTIRAIRWERAQEAQSAAVTLGVQQDHPIRPPGLGSDDLLVEVSEIVRTEARGRAADDAEQRYARRESYGEGRA